MPINNRQKVKKKETPACLEDEQAGALIKLFERDGKRGEMVLGCSRWSVDDMRNYLLITY